MCVYVEGGGVGMGGVKVKDVCILICILTEIHVGR